MTPNRRFFLKQLGLAGAGLGLVGLGAGCRTAPGATGNSLPRSTPEAQGVSSAGIQAFLDALARSKHELHSFMLVRHGQVVAEGWWGPYMPQFNHTMYSMSKSFTSTAVGFAVAEGRLTVNDKVLSFFPEQRPATVSDNLAALRVKDLLTMSVGNEKEPTQTVVKEQDWVKTFLAQTIAHPPGTVFMYNSAATYMCSAIVQKLTGQKINDYLRPRLFEPLGISGTTWETCPRGINTGGWGLSIPTEGLAKFGQLYLQQGKWKGAQILPAAWVNEATTFKIQQPLPAKPARPNAQNDWLQGYCYQFWRCQHNGFRGDGAFGQFTVVLPDQDAVVIMTGESNNLQGELDLVWEHLLPALKKEALPADRGTYSRLQQTLATLALPVPEGQPMSSLEPRISGKTFNFEQNDLGLQSVTFTFRNDIGRVVFKTATGEHAIGCGFDRWQRGETGLPGTPPRLISGGAAKAGTPMKIAVRAAWKSTGTLEMVWRYYETPHRDTITCEFKDNEVKMTFLNSIVQLRNQKDTRPVLVGKA